MAADAKSRAKETILTFAAGAGCGFLAGAFLVAVIVWQFGNVIGTRNARLQHPARTPAAVERWGDGMGDAGGVIEQADEKPTPTTGHDAAGPGGAPAGPPPDMTGRDLEIPVDGVRSDQLVRSFAEKRGSLRSHEAIDILAPEGTPVKAVDDGTVARLFISKAGGLTIYQFDPSQRFCYYYAHLQRYADGLREGQPLRKGQVIGYVGTSGNAPKNTPHLHFAVFRLTAEKHWWEGTPIDPYDLLH
jgi:murein DD-endopeptidase MepM/ murein hydrolase activator NlpD